MAASPGQRQVLDVANGMHRIGKAEADRRLNRVSPAPTGLVDHVARIVDHIGVVASAAKHLVGTGAAIQRVVAAKPPSAHWRRCCRSARCRARCPSR